MKQLFFILCIFSATFVSFAQEKAKKTPESKAAKKATEMTTTLKLNKEQEKMLYSTNLKAYQSIEDYDAKKPSKKLKRKQKDIVQKLREAEYKKILTPAQYKEYQLLEKEDDAKKKAEKKIKKEKKQVEKKSDTKKEGDKKPKSDKKK